MSGRSKMNEGLHNMNQNRMMLYVSVLSKKKSYKKDIKQESNFNQFVGNVDQNTFIS